MNSQEDSGTQPSNYQTKIDYFYNAIRSNDLSLVQKLLKDKENNTSTFCRILNSAYELLKLKNVPILEDIKHEVEWKLSELQFYSNKPPIKDEDFDTSFREIKEHLNFTCNIITTFLSLYEEAPGVDINLEFLLRAKFLVQHISVLKRRLLFTYKHIPWEEMEFCLVMFLCTLIKPEETDIIYQFVLDKKRVLNNLKYFVQNLLKIKIQFDEVDLVKETDSKKFNEIKQRFTENILKGKAKNTTRNMCKQNILAGCPQLIDLYDDFLLLRDVYSLNQIKYYIHRALSVNMEDNNMVYQLVIQRTLQVVGEYLKNERDSPNLSDELHSILIKSVSTSLKTLFKDLRNTLSHVTSLNKRLEMEDNTDITFFKNVQNDLKTIESEIVYVYYKQKLQALSVFLKKLLNSKDIAGVQVLIEKIKNAKLEESKHHEMPDLSKVKEIIIKFWEEIKLDLGENQDSYKAIFEIFDLYEKRVHDIMILYGKAVNAVLTMSNIKSIDCIHNLISVYLSIFKASDPKGIFEEIFAKLHVIYKTYKINRGFEENDTSASDPKLIKVTQIMLNIHNILKWDMQKINWIQKMQDKIVVTENNDQKVANVENLFKMIENNIHLNEEKVELQKAVADKIEYHLTKVRLVKSINEDPETFKSILGQLKPYNEIIIINNYTKMHSGKKNKLVELVKGIADDYGALVKNLEDMFSKDKYVTPITNFNKNLSLAVPLQTKVNKIVSDTLDKQKRLYYSKRLMILQNLVNSAPDIKCIKNNSNIITAIEILVLDLTEYLKKLDLLGDNKMFLIERSPILFGTQLRNHLAHGNILTEILPYDVLLPLLVYAKNLSKLGDTVVDTTGITIGYKVDMDNLGYSDYFINCLNLVKQQDHLFNSSPSISKKEFISLIENGADLKGRYADGRTIIDFVIIGKNMELTSYLMTTEILNCKNIFEVVLPQTLIKSDKMFNFVCTSTNIDLNCTVTTSQKNLLHFASELGKDAIVEFIIGRNSNPIATTIHGETALHFAAQSGNVKTVVLLLNRYPELINMKTVNNNTALHYAVQNGHYDIVNEIIQRKPDFSIINQDNLSAFEVSVKWGYLKIIDLFLTNSHTNLSIDQLTKAYWLAAEYGQSTVIGKILNENIDVNVKNSDEFSALHLAAIYGHINVVNVLLEFKVNVNETGLNNSTPLHLACQFGHIEIVRTLLNNRGNPEVIDNKSLTPLHWASYNNHSKVIEILPIDEVKTSFDCEGLTPFHIAAERGNIKTVEFFLSTNKVNVDCFSEKNQWSALHLAAGQGHVKMVEKLLEKKANVNIQAANNSTPLHWSIQRHGYLDIVNLLIDNSANINLQNSHGATALYVAALNGNQEIVKVLLRNKANRNLFDKNHFLPFHIAVQGGFTDIVRLLIDENTDINVATLTKLTSLHMAAENGYIQIVKLLLEKGANPNAEGLNKDTPIHLAAYNGHKDIIDVLLDRGVNINAEDITKKTPLLMAIGGKQEDTALHLLNQGASPKTTMNNNLTVLHSAILAGMENLILELVKRNIDINAPFGVDNNTPLHTSILKDNKNISYILLGHTNIDVNGRTNTGLTALHLACKKGFTDIVTVLLEKKADINVTSNGNLTPLHFAILSRHKDIVQLLIEHKDVNLDLRADGNTTALHMAAFMGDLDIFKYLLQKGCYDINEQTDKGATPLLVALDRGHVDISLELIKCNANPNIPDKVRGITALHASSKIGSIAIIQKLLKMEELKQETLNARSKDGSTALHYAVSYGNQETAILLLNNNIDTNAVNNKGKTALQTALENGFENISQVLKEHNEKL